MDGTFPPSSSANSFDATATFVIDDETLKASFQLSRE